MIFRFKIKLNKFKTLLSVLICIFLFLKESPAQPVQEWIRKYNGPANGTDIANILLPDGKGNNIVFGSSIGAGSLNDIVIIKYDAHGNTIWEQRFNGEGNSTDVAASACVDNSGNSYITGYTADTDLALKIICMKYDSSGKPAWIRKFSLPGYSNGFGHNIVLDSNGSLYVSGFLRNTVGNYDIVLIKYSESGNEIWFKTFNGEGNGDDFPASMCIDLNNNILIGGTSKSQLNGMDMIIMKYDGSSTLIWNKTFNGSADSDDRISSLTTNRSNNVYFCGSQINLNTSSDFYSGKLSQSGDLIWENRFNGTGNSLDIPYAMTSDLSGNIIVTGYSRNDSVIGSEDICTIKISSAGNVVWTGIYNGSGNGTDQGISLTTDLKGNVYVCGATDRGNVQLIYSLIKYDVNGIFQWFTGYSVVKHPEDFAYSVSADNSGNIVVTGISIDSVNDYDIVTIKYSQPVGINESIAGIPENYFLNQNYPNPFNPVTNLEFGIPAIQGMQELRYVTVEIYDVLGKKVTSLVNEKLYPGNYKVTFDGSRLTSGIYFCTLKTENFTETKRLLLIK